ncbi:hypothetical protein HRI_001532100 [Hibiscus trionum]|uniref:Uncharacterized protein n=1 Tax=Hibiscus trionum TaxID=183268 RepID=A0A9W7HJJ9_HIBTR|nr:hypothetical protein HRI_001532100 [Hibiscus trionum]
MATSSIIVTISLLLTYVALVLVLLPACTQARFFPTASVSQLESMVFNFGKIAKSPPPPSPAPSRHQATNEQPAPPSKRQGTIERPTQQSWSGADFQLNSMAADLGKTGWSPTSPKGKEIMEQLIQQRPSLDFQLASS